VAALAAGCVTAMILGGLASIDGPPSLIGAIIRIARTSLLFGVLYLGAVIILHRGFEPLHQVVRLLREMMPGRKPSKAPAVALAPKSAQVTP
jgi:hypothetical protein